MGPTELAPGGAEQHAGRGADLYVDGKRAAAAGPDHDIRPMRVGVFLRDAQGEVVVIVIQ